MSNQTNSLDWPDGFDRTAPEDRRPYPHNFRVETREAFTNILQELNKRDVENIRIKSSANHLSDRPNLPYASASPDDPGVVAYFEQSNQKYAVPCDQWDNLRDNAQAIAKYLSAKRALKRYNVETVENNEMVTQIYDP